MQARAVELAVLPELQALELTLPPEFLRALGRPFSQVAILVFEGATAGPQVRHLMQLRRQRLSAEYDVWFAVVVRDFCVCSYPWLN